MGALAALFLRTSEIRALKRPYNIGKIQYTSWFHRKIDVTSLRNSPSPWTISLSFRYEIERFQCVMSHKWMTYMLHVNPSMKNSHTQIWTLITLFRKYVPRETDFLLACLSVCGFPQFELTATCAYTFTFQLHSIIVCHLRHFCRWCALTNSFVFHVACETRLSGISIAKMLKNGSLACKIYESSISTRHMLCMLQW